MDYDLEPVPEKVDRRWPPVAAGGLALLMVALAFPNPFKIPENNPAASAEYAPVPGDSQGPQNANFAETQLATSSGVEARTAAAVLPTGFRPPPPVLKPRQKQCVGRPPRQSEDPLSPPCVPFFAGDNGGITFNGVTRDEIEVVLYNDWRIEGDMTKPYDPRDEPAEFGGARLDVTGPNLVRTIKAHLRFFQERFQTYGRRVSVTAQRSSAGPGSSCDVRKGDGSQTKGDYSPFAAMDFSGRAASCYIGQITAHRILNFGINWDLPPETYRRAAPYIFGFYPDQQTEALWSARFICRTLKDQPVKFSTDPTLVGARRVFGIVEPNRQFEQENDRQADRLVKQLDECGVSFPGNTHQRYKADSGSAGGASPAQVAQRFQDAGVTTVICYCSNGVIRQMQSQATTNGYFPEWYFDHGSRMFDAGSAGSTDGNQHHPFGITHFWRLPKVQQQYHYQAYLRMEPGSEPNERWSFDIYHQFLNLFTAIQSAGPRLTPDTIERGMFTFRYLDQDNGMLPVGGYGPYGPKAVADYSFIDTAVAWWWDPAGTPPGGDRGEGCLRLMNGAHRYFADEWPRTQEQLFDNITGVCTADPAGGGDGGGFFFG